MGLIAQAFSTPAIFRTTEPHKGPLETPKMHQPRLGKSETFMPNIGSHLRHEGWQDLAKKEGVAGSIVSNGNGRGTTLSCSLGRQQLSAPENPPVVTVHSTLQMKKLN